MNIDENTDFKKLKRKLFFSTLFNKFILGIFWLFYGIWKVIKFIFAPIALVIELFILVPLIYFTHKQEPDIQLDVIDMDILHDVVFEEIQEDIAIFENHGFEQIKLVQGHLVDDKGTLFTQLMLNEPKGIVLSLMYGVFKDSDGEYSNIQISYQEFGFKTNSGEEFEFHNAKKESIPMTNRVTRLYIEEYDSETLYKKVLDISQKLNIVINKNTMQEIRNKPSELMKKSYQTDMEYLLKTGFFKLKDNYLRPSFKASILSVFKEMWPVSGYLTKKSWERTLKYLNDIGFNIEAKNYYAPTNSEIPLDKKITTTQHIEEFLSIYHTNHLQPAMIEFRLDETENIDETIINLAHQKPIGRGKCIFTNTEIVINNSNAISYIYDYQNSEIRVCNSKKYIKEFQNIISPKEILTIIKEKYTPSYIDNMLLTPEHYEVVIEIDDNGVLSYETLYIDCKSGKWITNTETFENDPME